MKKYLLFAVCFSLFAHVAAADEFADVESYDADTSLFQKIADMEQEKVLMQLEKDKAQLQLDLDRLSAEKARIVREQENADARAEEQAAEIERQKLAIEQERQKLDEQKRKLAEEAAKRAVAKDDDDEKPKNQSAPAPVKAEMAEDGPLTDKYILREIVGAGNQLFATVENVGTGKQKKLSVGKTLDGYTVRSISLDDGIEFVNSDAEVVTLGVGSFPSGVQDD